MKKYLFLLIALFVLAACVNEYETDGSHSYEHLAGGALEQGELAQVTTPVTTQAPHINQIYLDDFEYMMAILESSFPYFGIAERRFGTYLDYIVANTLYALKAENITDTVRFWQIMFDHFFQPMNHIGHLSVQNRDTLHLILGNIHRGPITYNGEFLDMQGRDFTNWGQMFIDVARSEAAQQFYGYIEVRRGYEAGMFRQNNLRTEILQPGIAYVQVQQFWHYNINRDRATMMAFYEQIRGFDHLIIDLRGNGGGFTRYFVELFLSPNIAYDIVIPGIYTLMMGSPENLAWVEAQFYDDYFFAGVTSTKMPLDPTHFPQLHPDDAAMFDYIMTRPVNIASTGDVMFDGDIWILVDGTSASAVEYAILYAMNAGFATIVGEPTRGVTGGGFAGFFALPNTGLVIRYDFGYFVDSYGRAIDEFGVIPHYENMPGMNALETTLELIRQR